MSLRGFVDGMMLLSSMEELVTKIATLKCCSRAREWFLNSLVADGRQHNDQESPISVLWFQMWVQLCEIKIFCKNSEKKTQLDKF